MVMVPVCVVNRQKGSVLPQTSGFMSLHQDDCSINGWIIFKLSNLQNVQKPVVINLWTIMKTPSSEK